MSWLGAVWHLRPPSSTLLRWHSIWPCYTLVALCLYTPSWPWKRYGTITTGILDIDLCARSTFLDRKYIHVVKWPSLEVQDISGKGLLCARIKKGLQKELKVMTPFRTSALKALKRYWSQECRFEGLSSYKGNAMKGIIAPRWFLRWGLRGTSSCLSVQLSPPCTKSRESKTPL